MSALIIRPEGKCEDTVRIFKQRGLDAIGLPALKIQSNEQRCAQFKQRLLADTPPDMAIFTSTYAAQFIDEVMHGHQWPETMQIICIGRSTAAVFKSWRTTCEIPELSTSEGVLAMTILQNVEGRKIVIAKGVGGRTLLTDMLSTRCADVENFDCYERLPNIAVIEKISQYEQVINCVIATSGEIIELACKSMGSKWRLKPWVVVSQRTAEIARSFGISQVIISPSAQHDDLYKTCKNLLNNGVLNDG